VGTDFNFSCDEEIFPILLYELLTQRRTNLLAVSDGGADEPEATAPSVGYLSSLTKKSYGNAKTSHEVTQSTPTARKVMVASPYLTHYFLYLEIQISVDLCITSYCDNYSLLKKEENFHTQDIDSSSWYTNPDHDVIMTLGALRTKFPLCLASLQVHAHQDENCEFNLLSRPAQLNVLADEDASEVLEDLQAADQPTKF
jgi:hypothetical protein